MYIQYSDKLDVAYRFLDPNYGTGSDGGDHEETKSDSDVSFGGSATTVNSSLYWRTLRMISPDNLGDTAERIQIAGPRDYNFYPTPSNFKIYDADSPDPGIPQPLNYALANTYREVADPTSVFNTSRTTAACGKTFILLFPGQGMNDSYEEAMKQDVAQLPSPGDSSIKYDTALNSASLAPDAAAFFGGLERISYYLAQALASQKPLKR